MDLFRAQTDNPFSGPHQNGTVEQAGAKSDDAEAAMILVHGRGATAAGMMGLAREFDMPTFRYLAPQASGHTWYPNSFLEDKEKNQPGLDSGLQALHDLFNKLAGEGIPAEKTVLLGFSQGACLATEYAARHPRRFGGVVGYSGGLIGPSVDASAYSGDLEGTPVFLGCSDRDPHIPQERVETTAQVLEGLGGEVTKKIYPNMPHTVNEDELNRTRDLMTRLTTKK
ncbi:MAG: alpha/beta hydrolase [Balneolaceae bacterium]|nr:alpha/beta hydrolase [Balneolaceae bacterium]